MEVTHKRKGGVLEKPRPIYYGAKMEAGTDLEFTVDVNQNSDYVFESKANENPS